MCSRFNMDRIIKGKIDEYGFPYLETEIINPENGLQAFNVKTIIDTGSAYTLVKPELLNGIKITNSIGTTELLNPIRGENISNIFEIDLKINNFRIPKIKARELKEHTYPCGILIGIDIIKYCNFEYNSKTNSFTLELMTNT